MSNLKIKIINILNLDQKNIFKVLIDGCIAIYILSTLILGQDINTLKYCKLSALLCVFSIIIYYLFKCETKFKNDIFIRLFCAFVIFSFISCFWAYDFNRAWDKSFSLLQNFIVIFFVYDYSLKNNKTNYIINLLAVSGFIYSVYIIFSYGFLNYISIFALGQKRLGSEIANTNFIGVSCLFSAIIILWKVIIKKDYYFFIPFLFCSAIAIGTGSKKVLFGGLLSFFLFVFFKTTHKSFIKNTIILILIFSSLIPLLSNLSFFHKLVRRTEIFLQIFTKTGEADFSTNVRLEMIKIGWREFQESPLLGIGIGNSGIVLKEKFWDTYFHNNFTEIFTSLGFIGGFLYYIFFLYPVFILLQRKYRMSDEYILCLTLVLIRLFLHIGMVDYYLKSSFLYILLSYLIVKDKLINYKYINNYSYKG